MGADTITVLVVDDDSLSRTLLCTNLREAGYAVREADGGRRALDLLREQPVDVILLDLVMPEMDGFHVLQRVKADNALRNTPVIVVSGAEDMESVTRCLRLGAVDHLSKPFDPALLQARLHAALAIRRLQEQDEQRRQARMASPVVQEEAAPPVAAEAAAESKPGMGPVGFARCLLHWLRPYKREATLFGALLLTSMGITAALPLGFKYLTDYALTPHDPHALLVILAVLVLAEIVCTGSDVGRDYYFSRFAASVLNDMRFNMFRVMQRLSMGYYGRVSSGDITARFTTDLAAVDYAISTALSTTLCQCVLIPISLGLLFALEWRLALISTIGLYVSLKAEGRVEPRAEEANQRMKEQQARIAAVLQENVQAQPVIKVFRLQATVIERFKHQMLDFHRTAARACFLSYLTYRVPNRCISAVSLAVLGLGAALVYHGDLTIGTLASFQILLAGLVSSVSDLTWGLPQLLQAGVGMERIQELLDQEVEVTDADNATALARPTRQIELKEVRFGYSAEHLNLDNVTLTVPLNRSVLLVGPSGCGKSTVLNLLMRFYDPVGGCVAIDGRDIRTVTQDSLRAHMSVVLQESFLFDTTVRENIRIGRPGATDAQVEEAARTAEVHDVILKMSAGYDTMVGERGGKLSGGQRQRIAIARAILCDPAILLLDEATSALDPATAAAINQALERIGKGRTVVSVTHRLESAPAADGIFVFREGRLVEQGRHDELLQQGGLYAQLWRKQTGLSISEDGSRAHVEAARLRDIPLLENLDDASLAMVAGLFVTEHAAACRLVVQQGDPGDRFYIIVRGRVAVSRTTPTGEEQPLAVLEDGDHFGEVALIRRVPRTATVRTLTDCVFLSLTGEQFLRLVEANVRLREALEHTLVDRARTAEDQPEAIR